MVFNQGMTRNSNRTWELTFADGSVVTFTCRNSLGSFAKHAEPLRLDRGLWVECQEVQTF